jgi:hypothetical protein
MPIGKDDLNPRAAHQFQTADFVGLPYFAQPDFICRSTFRAGAITTQFLTGDGTAFSVAPDNGHHAFIPPMLDLSRVKGISVHSPALLKKALIFICLL